MTKKKKEVKPGIFYRYLSVILVVVTIITMGLLYFIDLLPLEYFIIACIIEIIIEFILIKWLFIKNIKRVISSILSLLLIVGMFMSIIYEISTIGFLKKFGDNNYKIITYDVVVLDDSNYDDIKDLKDKYIGILDSQDDDYSQALKHLDNKVSVEKDKYSTYGKASEMLLTNELDAILIEDSQNEILKEESSDYKNNTRILYDFEIEVKTSYAAKAVDVTKEPFNIYISGIDTYGSINSVSRSDVNIVVSINPTTHKIRFTSIPRDYYVKLHTKTKYKDKLTHAGIYGIEESIGTVEDLLDIDINYYVKVNFTSVIKIVDAIGGIEVNSNYTFSTGIYDTNTEPYSFKEGINKLNGKQALAFARERKAFNGGDRIRNENQQLVLEAMLDKVISPSILVKYTSLIDSLDGAFKTNLTDDEITTLIKEQLSSNAKWDISSVVLKGTDDYDYTYSYQSGKSYVMVPDEESVNNAKEDINNIIFSE